MVERVTVAVDANGADLGPAEVARGAAQAAASGTRVVLFGPVSPAEWGPPAERTRHRAIWAGASGDPHAERPDPGLLAITVPEVLDALERLPALSAAHAA